MSIFSVIPVSMSSPPECERCYSRGMMPCSTSCSRVRLCWSLNCSTAKETPERHFESCLNFKEGFKSQYKNKKKGGRVHLKPAVTTYSITHFKKWSDSTWHQQLNHVRLMSQKPVTHFAQTSSPIHCCRMINSTFSERLNQYDWGIENKEVLTCS